MFAHDLLLAGNDEVIVAGAMDSMTNAPYLPRTEGEQAGPDSDAEAREATAVALE
jgi:acetyl-CoA acetyltransferase